MNIFLITSGTLGDIHPFIGLGICLKNNGHRVHLICAEVFKNTVVDAGLEHHSLETAASYHKRFSIPDFWHPQGRLERFASTIDPITRTLYQTIHQYYVENDTLVITIAFLFIHVQIVQALLLCPVISVCLAPTALTHLLNAKGLFESNAIILPAVNAVRQSYGLPLLVESAPLQFLKYSDVILGFFPEWLLTLPEKNNFPDGLLSRFQATGFLLFDPVYSMAPEEKIKLENFLKQGGKPIIFTLGTGMQQEEGRQFFKTSVLVCEQLKIRGIFLSRYSSLVPTDLPDAIIHIHYTPLQDLLLHSQAIVHHGGIGTCAQAIVSGIRQCIVPVGFDQFDNARKMESLGFGICIPLELYATKALEGLTRLLKTKGFQQEAYSLIHSINPTKASTSIISTIQQVMDSYHHTGGWDVRNKCRTRNTEKDIVVI